MAKKKKIKETTIEDFYDLKVDKVDELVAALKGEDTSEYGEVSMKISDCTGDGKASDKEFNPYRTDFLSRIPTFLKAFFIKWWFAGVVCFFINMGLGPYVATADLVVLDGVFLGLVVEVLVNPLFRFMETDKREYNDYIMFPFPFKAYWTFFTNVLYYVIVAVIVNFVYLFINTFMFRFNIEPLSWALIVLVIDMIFIGIKDLGLRLVKKRKREETSNV
ncbi:MAG: hypothetical protein K2N23_05880 [Clostridia bacterium]|nr:hypothetical protein [Clostridia bacterium]